MSTLHEFQQGMVDALLSDGDAFPDGAFAGGGISLSAGTAVYRNNVFAALTKALGDLYPVVKQLVGNGFFAYAANDYVIARHPGSSVPFDRRTARCDTPTARTNPITGRHRSIS